MSGDTEPGRRAAGGTWSAAETSAVLLLAGLWWLLTDGSPQSWVVGLPSIVAAAWLVRRQSNGTAVRLSLAGAARFIPFFLWQSFRGGVDVALRTLAPSLPVQPGFSRHRVSLDTPVARTFFINCVSLLPGTLAADIHEQWVEVHVISTDSEFRRELSRLELAVARLFMDPGVER